MLLYSIVLTFLEYIICGSKRHHTDYKGRRVFFDSMIHHLQIQIGILRDELGCVIVSGCGTLGRNEKKTSRLNISDVLLEERWMSILYTRYIGWDSKYLLHSLRIVDSSVLVVHDNDLSKLTQWEVVGNHCFFIRYKVYY